MLIKKQYLSPEMVVEALETSDIVTASIATDVNRKGLTTSGMAETGLEGTSTPWDEIKDTKDLG